MELESRIDGLISALDEVLDYELPSGLELLVALIAGKVDEGLMSEMQRGEQ
jgi:hypothetical protein